MNPNVLISMKKIPIDNSVSAIDAKVPYRVLFLISDIYIMGLFLDSFASLSGQN